MEDLIELAWKAAVASGVLMLVVLCGQRAGPLLASIAMTYPFNVGVGFSLMVLERSDDFMAAAGLAGFALAGGVFSFMTGYVVASPLGGFLKPWLVGVAAWGGVAAIAVSFPISWPLAIALAGGGALAAAVLVKKRETPPVQTRGGGTGRWSASIARAVLGGVIIAVVAVYSKALGPAISGMALAFPTMMSASLWILNRRFGDAFAAETVYRSRWALASYTSFVLFMGLLAVPLGDVVAMVVSALIAAAVSFLVYRINRPA
ncbi:MAG TPA: hypothetical protein VKA18_12315 [Alphaproteobacteria bacterium]|nr:hypothetical protein [Alphaproteobacteria bacterium]